MPKRPQDMTVEELNDFRDNVLLNPDAYSLPSIPKKRAIESNLPSLDEDEIKILQESKIFEEDTPVAGPVAEGPLVDKMELEDYLKEFDGGVVKSRTRKQRRSRSHKRSRGRARGKSRSQRRTRARGRGRARGRSQARGKR